VPVTATMSLFTSGARRHQPLPDTGLESYRSSGLDCKREVLTLPMPDPNDDSIEAHRTRSLLLAAADSTIEQTIRLKTSQLTPAANDDEVGKVIEERLAAAKLEIAGLEDEDSYGKTPKPN
jgi:hypothetical protein